MLVRCRTNIDCCQPFMEKLFQKFVPEASPLIGDRVVVYQDYNKCVELSVVGRTWGTTTLFIELGLLKNWQGRLPEFERWVKS